MKIKIVINTRKEEDSFHRTSEVWSGELDIFDDEEYLTMISVMAEGQPQPICQVPFSIGVGHYVWVPPDNRVERDMGDDILSGGE